MHTIMSNPEASIFGAISMNFGKCTCVQTGENGAGTR